MAFFRHFKLDRYILIIYDSKLFEGRVRLYTCSDSSDIPSCHPCDGYQFQINMLYTLNIISVNIDMYYTVFCHVYVYMLYPHGHLLPFGIFK